MDENIVKFQEKLRELVSLGKKKKGIRQMFILKLTMNVKENMEQINIIMILS